jgi:5'-deoxynucleotidase YfbR-like HD superfamily hydrolase
VERGLRRSSRHRRSQCCGTHELVRAYESEDSIESRLAHDADKIETLLQAREHEAQGGHDTAQWQDSSTAALRTETAKQLADPGICGSRIARECLLDPASRCRYAR